MLPAQQSRVLRCCSCRLFQAHQVKKSLKWTCKVCGEKQSFVRAYGEGSGADCRRHVQKLNLLQGQAGELSLGPVCGAPRSSHAIEEESTSPQQAEDGSPQIAVPTLQGNVQPWPSRWLKYLDEDCAKQELGGGGAGGLQTGSLPGAPRPGPGGRPALARKRKWSQSPGHPAHDPGAQDVASTGRHQGPSTVLGTQHHPEDLSSPRWKPPSPALQTEAPSSTWAQSLLAPSKPLQEGPRPAYPAQSEQGTPMTKSPREGWLPHTTPASLAERPSRKTPELSWRTGTRAEDRPLAHGAQKVPSMQLGNLFTTGEDFEDDL